ncbi:unnamed protein product [Urochloa decumbens]|uniref:DUF6598 domain-containing protein n=1 Tax=Urochloa decumbens TaxID=240449 RepID=A0ABC8X2J2_9POAL
MAAAAASTLPDQLLDRLSRFAYEPWSMQPSIDVLCEKKLPKLDEHLPFPSATTQVMDKAEMMETEKVKDDSVTATDGICTASILKNSSHRDGAIYKGNWEECYLIDIADRKETGSGREVQQVQPDAVHCYPDQENCICHRSSDMMQIFSLRLAKTPNNSGSAQLYGYVAARDDLDGLLNYVFNRSRDDPIIVQQGSLIEMSGPKRGILMLSDVLIEFDLRIKNGGKEEDDLQLIDGLIHYDERMWWCPFTERINGNGGAVDMCLTLVNHAVEATIQVDISEVHSAFALSLTSFVSIMGKTQEIQLFHGTVGKSCGLKQCVAVPIDAMLHLKFMAGENGSGSEVVHNCSFNAKLHGCANRQIKLELACISMNVSWSPPLC